jgi:hypothetical protein
MKTQFIGMLSLAAAIFCAAAPAQASLISSIQFQDGNFLDVQGVFGSGDNTAYLAININGGANVAWQFNWPTGANVSGWQMMEDIAGQSILSTSGVAGTNTVTNPDGDPDFTITATFYPSFNGHFVTNMQDASSIGVANDWEFYNGTYSAANVSAANPQGMTWTLSNKGIDALTLTSGQFIGWVDVFPHPPTPVLPEIALPEPSAAILLLVGGALLARRRTSHLN